MNLQRISGYLFLRGRNPIQDHYPKTRIFYQTDHSLKHEKFIQITRYLPQDPPIG